MSTTAAEITKLIDTAERASSSSDDKAQIDRALDALKLLRGMRVTTQLLLDTQAGKRVKKLSKHADKGIAQAATAVVDAWKEAVKQENKDKEGKEGKASQSQSQGDASRPASEPTSKAASEAGDDLARLDSGPDGSAPLQRTQSSPAPTGNDKRDKARALLAEALKLALGDVPQGDTGEVAAAVEDAMLAQAGGVNQAYFNKCRSLSFNLKKADNPDLRRDVLSGMIPPERLVTMTAEEMAPERVKQENQKIREKMMFEVQRGGQQKATTDQFQCGKCKQRKTTFYQLQTRSADEPMTTFVTCVNCNNRWKFC